MSRCSFGAIAHALILALALANQLLVQAHARRTPCHGVKAAPFAKTAQTVKVNRIFQIGFNKASTHSLWAYFSANNVPGVHYGGSGEKSVATSISKRAQRVGSRRVPLLDPLLLPRECALFLSDMESLSWTDRVYVGVDYFRRLDEENPGSKFILNVRDRSAWVQSRLEHWQYPERSLSALGMDPKDFDGLARRWEREWDEHIEAVKIYFASRPGDLLVLDLERGSKRAAEELNAFFRPYFGNGFGEATPRLPHLGRRGETPRTNIATMRRQCAAMGPPSTADRRRGRYGARRGAGLALPNTRHQTLQISRRMELRRLGIGYRNYTRLACVPIEPLALG